MRRSPRVQRLNFHLPPYDTPRVASCNNPEFHVDRTHAVGGVCEQTKRLYENICIDQDGPLLHFKVNQSYIARAYELDGCNAISQEV